MLTYGLNDGLHADFVAEGALDAFTLTKPGTDKAGVSSQLAPATATTDVILGAVQEDVASGDPCALPAGPNVPWVLLGGSVNLGDFLTTDGNSAAVAASSGNHFFGIAGKGGVSGDKIPYLPMIGIM